LVLSGGPDTLNLAQHNDWFAGGNGDFTVILDRAGVYFYFLFGTYYKDVAQQGVSIARMRYADRFAPVGKVTKWHNGGWSQPGLMGDVTPIFPARADWYCPEPDTFWGPSIHWNSAIEQYVILMNQAVDPSWKQGGIYISFSPDVADPSSWTEPARILAPDGWYPEVIGTGAGGGETDRALGKDARLFIHGISDYQISFSKIGR
ncbi:MAG: hypothetical protein JW750_00795, partial [Anaerolineaceae bacterium]|nr:hypothetical protein [Anaerolineaceae bacterium]